MRTILFQGDSITDADRSRQNDGHRGVGYPTLVSSDLGFTYPTKYVFLNRGISGNRVVDLYSRIKADFINLNPTYISILIGVNDVWHELSSHNGVDAVKFEKVYSMLVEEILKACLGVRMMLLEPFVLNGTATDDKYDAFRPEVEKRAVATKHVAEKYELSFVPLQAAFDKATERAPASYWLGDGVHPTSAGHELIAREWVRKFEEIK